MPSCVDELSFVQLTTTLRKPFCEPICFRWAATKGTFIDPTASDPLYVAPDVCLPGGEEVLITLLITMADGVRYTDQVHLRVRDVP